MTHQPSHTAGGDHPSRPRPERGTGRSSSVTDLARLPLASVNRTALPLGKPADDPPSSPGPGSTQPDATARAHATRGRKSSATPVRKPCPSCPWRVDQTARAIPGFSLDLAESLDRTCSGEFGAPVFACHQSRPGGEFPCAGWLAIHGHDSIAVRLMVLQGRVPPEALESGADWPELHGFFDEVIAKLRATT